jgi:soluble epoxide hydrolase / lipid-phosphate phosphatase
LGHAKELPHALKELAADINSSNVGYKSHVFGHQSEEPNPDNRVVNVPTLFLGYNGDVVCRKEGILPSVQAGVLPQLTNVTLDGGHWGLLEHPKEFGESVIQWLQKSYES